jgi:hypothetical protein
LSSWGTGWAARPAGLGVPPNLKSPQFGKSNAFETPV